MLGYIICFSLTILFTFFAQKSNSKKQFIFFSILAILIPSIFAGIRDISIGSDVKGYLSDNFNKALRYKDFGVLMHHTNEEVGFLGLEYITSLFTDNIHILMFLIEFIIMIFFYKFISAKREKMSMTLMMTVYLLLCYSESLCIMRQHISLAIILFSTTCLENKKYKKTIFYFLLAYLFHKSSIISLLLYLLIIIKNSKINDKSKRIIYTGIIILPLIIVIMYKPIMLFLINNLHILPSRYNLYFKGYSSKSGIFSGRMLFKFFWLTIVLFSLKLNDNDDSSNNYLLSKINSLIILLYDLSIYVISANIIVVSRLSYFLFYPVLLNNSDSLINLVPKFKFSKRFGYVVLIMVLLFYFYITIIKNSNSLGGYHTYPYISVFSE